MVLRRRLPSAKDAVYAFLACLVPIGGWSVFRMLDEGVPVWVLQMRPWDVIGTVAYVQAFALLEGIVIFLALLLLAFALPSQWFRDKFVPLATALIYASAAWFVAAHQNDETLRTWGWRQLLPWIGAYSASLLLISAVVHRSVRLQGFISSYVDRVSVLAGTYLAVAAVAVIVVLFRNL